MSTDNGRDSKSKRLGVKLFGGQTAKAGNIIIRQRGTKYHAGENVYLSKDFSIHAAVDGKVFFKKRRLNRTFVSIIPTLNEVVETVAKGEHTSYLPQTQNEEEQVRVIEEAVANAPVATDDLTKIEGIGPKIAEILNSNGILTFEQLAASSAESIKEMLTNAGPRYAVHEPATWSKQAAMAAAGDWEELKAYQDILDGGKEPEVSTEE
ncbi:MAG: 50S ribosomal protein L27 [Saprospiraceae bacterium]|nr:50S ribosomal protein L27 [Saprospiraceae bacterium]